MVALLERNLGGCGAYNGDRVTGHEYITVGRFAAAVDNNIVNPVAEHQQGALRRVHANVYAGLLGYSVPPYTGCIYRYGRAVFRFEPGAGVEDLDAKYSVSLADEVDKLGIYQNFGPVHGGVGNVGRAKAERIDRAVGNHNRANQGRVDRRLHLSRLGGRYGPGFDARAEAGVYEFLLVVESESGLLIFGEGDEQSSGIFNAVGSDRTKDLVFPYAFFGRLAVFDRIAGARMEQAVVAAGCSGGNVVTFYQQYLKTSHSAVARSARACDAATDDNHVKLVFGWHIVLCYSLL